MLLKLSEVSGVGYDTLKRLEVGEFMTIYHTEVQEARKKRK